MSESEEIQKPMESINLSGEKKAEKDLIFSLLSENKVNEALEYVKSNKLKEVDCLDEHGTTPLQYAAFRGFYSLCELLIEKGADVNAKTHYQGYSALMFAAISNHTQVVRLLLKHDADTDYTNMIGRTASQMASFVNSNESVDAIKSHIPRKSLDYFTEIRSINETEPKLPKGECADELYNLLTRSINYCPVRVLLNIKSAKENILIKNIDKIQRTLNAFCKRAFKIEETDCPNDLLAFKIHYFKYFFDYLNGQFKAYVEKKENAETKSEEIYDKLIDNLLKKLISEEECEVKTPDGIKTIKFRVFAEKFLRESIRQFPYKECALVRQMVTVLAKSAIGEANSALYVITSCLNGQRFGQDSDEDKVLQCTTCCEKSVSVKLCSHCKRAAYCDQVCQKLHWPLHKKENI